MVSPIAAPQFTYYEATGLIEHPRGRRKGASSKSLCFPLLGMLETVELLPSPALMVVLEGPNFYRFDYINGDVAFSNSACSNCRNAYISVMEGDAVQAQMPISAQVSRKFLCMDHDLFVDRAGTPCSPVS